MMRRTHPLRPETRRFGFSLALTAAALALVACGGGGDKGDEDTTGMAPPPAETGTGDVTRPTPGNPPEGATAAMVAEGDSIFHGELASGICFTCHGVDAKGTALAPSLVDSTWATGDGSFAFIQKRVTEGMPNPTPPYTSPMLPMGGAQLSADQIKAVASYVYSISH